MPSRRRFLRLSTVSPALAGLLPSFSLTDLFAKAPTKPVIISTWDSGVTPNKAAWPLLQAGARAIDAIERAGTAIENEPSCCVGLGGNPDRDGYVTLDACIMDEQANCGSVAFLERIKHPISVARKVMDTTPHVMLVGSGAQQFALQNGFKLEPAKLSADAEKAFTEWKKKAQYKPIINIENHDTMGTVALDLAGNLSGMCTTSGMAFKMRGRVGDSPLIGPGLFVDNEVGAVTGSGQGEEVIRIGGAAMIVEAMRQGLSPKAACQRIIERIVKRDPERAKSFQVGFIAVNKQGEIGAFAVQKGFSYTLTTSTVAHQVFQAESYL